MNSESNKTRACTHSITPATTLRLLQSHNHAQAPSSPPIHPEPLSPTLALPHTPHPFPPNRSFPSPAYKLRRSSCPTFAHAPASRPPLSSGFSWQRRRRATQTISRPQSSEDSKSRAAANASGSHNEWSSPQAFNFASSSRTTKFSPQSECHRSSHIRASPTFLHACVRARSVLPKTTSYEDAIFNISRAAMLVNCFATSQFDPLRFAMEDRLHQQYRTHMFPFEPLIEAAVKAGAHAAFLSGAGPSRQ